MIYLIPVHLSVLAEVNRSTLNQYLFHVQKYADSNCIADQEMRLSSSALGQLNDEESTPQEKDVLRDALAGIRDGMLAAMMGEHAGCKAKLTAGIVKARTTISTKPISVPNPPSTR